MEVAIQDFSMHMKEAHKKELIPAASSWNAGFLLEEKIIKSNKSWFFVPHSLEGQGIFFAYLHLKARRFHLWVHSVGDQDVAEKFRLKIKLSGTDIF